ncbi:hypothetical protein ACTNDZ_02985 [Selenomonas montiformis]|uniref:hypothetical protein n=1 Tax=Selenomonas montiformis TaxID=2652285 RepID=UPI003F896BD6
MGTAPWLAHADEVRFFIAGISLHFDDEPVGQAGDDVAGTRSAAGFDADFVRAVRFGHRDGFSFDAYGIAAVRGPDREFLAAVAAGERDAAVKPPVYRDVGVDRAAPAAEKEQRRKGEAQQGENEQEIRSFQQFRHGDGYRLSEGLLLYLTRRPSNRINDW